MNRILIDFNKPMGRVKPMHAVNNTQSAPYDPFGGLDKFAAAHIPYSRLHDTGGAFGGARFVDIANVFPCFDADENDPASYDFAYTDVLLSAMSAKGIKPFYRLGTTIENFHKIKAYHIFPPKDYAKWARICEHIVLHYNEGWADGFHMDIEYWEIWNEPDNERNPLDNACWRGTKEDYYELYRVASIHLKSKFPHLKIGGYASCGFYELTHTIIQAANSSQRTEYFLEFFEGFLAFCRDNACPLDFFSWHSYAPVKDNILYAAHARERLDAYGFTACEVFLNEWNPGTHNRGKTRDAADILAMMIGLQNTSTDMCMYYNAAERTGYCGIFNPLTHEVFKAYYSFFVFGQMYAMGEQTFSETDEEKIYVMAARGNGKKGFAIVNHSKIEKTLELSVLGADLSLGKVKAVDDDHTFDDLSPMDATIVLPPYSIRYVEFE